MKFEELSLKILGLINIQVAVVCFWNLERRQKRETYFYFVGEVENLVPQHFGLFILHVYDVL